MTPRKPNPDHPPASPAPEAIELFCDYLRLLEIEPAADFGDFQKQHAVHATDLTGLLDQYERVTAILERLTPAASFSARLREHYGADIDPEISLDGHGPVGAAPNTTASKNSGRVLSRLAAQPPSTTRYDTQREIARGGMGAIMEVWDKELRRTLAMKVVLGGAPAPGSSQSSEDKAERRLSRFLEEAQITGQLDHPGIVPVHDIGIDETGRVYFTMQLVDGHDLRRVFELARLEKDGWSQVRVVSVFARVCEAMAYAHSKSVVHRDLKPANIMVGAFGEAFVMDWGLAKVLGSEEPLVGPPKKRRPERPERVRTDRSDSDTGTDDALRTLDGDVVGTPAYMAPEQARGHLAEIGVHSDIYAMGAMLYHLLAGQAPYEPLGEKVPAHTILEAVRKSSPWPLVQIQPEVNAELAAICEKAMSREPAERYSSMMKLGEDLRAWVEGREVRAYTTGTFYALRKWVARNRLLAGALAALLVLVVTSLVVFTVQQSRNLENVVTEQAKTEKMRLEAESSAKDARDGEAQMRIEKDRADQETLRAKEQSTRADNAAAAAGVQRTIATQAQKSAEGIAYRSSVNAAAYSLQLDDADGARRSLEACQVSLRGWEWNHVSIGTDTSIGRPIVHESGLFDLAADGSGELLLTYGIGFRPPIWNALDRTAQTGVQLPVVGIGAVTKRLRFNSLRCALSPNARAVALAEPGNNAFSLVNVSLGNVLYSFREHDKPITHLAISHDGAYIATASEDGLAMVIEFATARVFATLAAHEGAVLDVAFSADDKFIATCGTDRVLRIWNPQGDLQAELAGQHTDAILSLDWSPDGERIVTGSRDGSLVVWNVERESIVTVMHGHRGAVHDVLFSHDGLSVFSASEDQTVRQWAASSGRSERVFNGHRSDVHGLVRLGRGGTAIASASADSTIRFWNARWRPERTDLPSAVDMDFPGLFFAPDNRTLRAVSVASGVLVYDADAALITHSLNPLGETLSVPEPAPQIIAVAADTGRYAVVAGFGVIEIYSGDQDGKVEKTLQDFGGVIRSLAFSNDGARLAVEVGRRTVLSIDVESDERVPISLTRNLSVVAINADGTRIATAESDESLRLWDARTGRSQGAHRDSHSKSVTCLEFSPDGSVLISGSVDRAARVWDLPALEFRAPELVGHQEAVTSISCSPIAGRIATGAASGRVRIWSLEEGDLLLTVQVGSTAVEDLCFSADGKRLAVSCLGEGVCILESEATDQRYGAWSVAQTSDPGTAGASSGR